MRTGWLAMALMVLHQNAAAADVTVQLTADGPASTYWAKRAASSLFEKAGITVAWRALPPAAGEVPRTWVRVELAEQTPENLLPGALAVSYPYGKGRKSITVFHDRVRQRARGMANERALLAYVLVHEIAHVIQGVDRHSETGVMKARWENRDYEAIFSMRLGFAAEDLPLLERGLALCWCREAAPAASPSSRGTAFRPE